jgi:hypothetical protein
MSAAFDNENRNLFKKSLKCMVMLAMMVIVSWAWAGDARAHSTEGRVRVVLDKAKPTYDDFAYFIEPYVNQEKYKGIHQTYMGRFYAMDVVELRTQGREAEATFEVLDVSSNQRFLETMRFTRGNDGIWRYTEAEGGPREVFTYIPRWRHILETYIQPVALVGLPLLVVLLVLLRLRRNKNKKIFTSKKPGIVS